MRERTKIFDEVQNLLNQHHAGQQEFHDAVNEMLFDIISVEKEKSSFDLQSWQSFVHRLVEPDRVIRFKVEWRDDQGKTQVNRGWRVQFNNSLGAYKGGLRFHPSCNESILKFLAFEQVFKNALTGLPMGGAKGGADFDPKGKSEREVYNFCIAFMNELSRYIGQYKDVPAGDIGVGAQEIAYMYGQYIKLFGQSDGVLTGKDPSFGGSCGRVEATGHGVIYLLQSALEAHGEKLSGKNVLISGAGNVALYAAQKALEYKAHVLSFSDSEGTLYFKKGISADQLDQLIRFKTHDKGRLKNWKTGEGCDFLPDQRPWQIKADIALPCATQNEVSKDDVIELIKNKCIALAEGANRPLEKEAVKEIQNSKTIYLPAKAANAGGVAVSGLERSQNAGIEVWTLEKVDCELKKIMSQIHKNCSSFKNEYNIIDYKKGANYYAFTKVQETMLKLWP